ncbi:MAG: pyridoxal-phosphate dependent enzyme [Sulfolobales archaeon]
MNTYYLECISCGSIFRRVVFKCPKCGGLPIFRYLVRRFEVSNEKPGVWRYASYLPPINNIISRGEGLTPISNVDGVLVKNERFNPTASYSDRASAVIASYLISNKISSVITSFEEDFTYSLAYYLNGISGLEVVVKDVLSLDIGDISMILEANAKLTTTSKVGEAKYLEYMNPLTVEGLKTIAFEIVERRVKVERIVVPARTGILAYAIYKGIKESTDANMGIPYEVVAATMKGDYISNTIRVLKDIKFVEVDEEDVLNSIIKLSRRGIKTKPISALAYSVAENLGNAVAVVTMGFKTAPYYGRRNNNIKKEVYRIIKEAGEITAYEVWKRAPIYTLRGIYKLLQSMEKQKEVCSEVMYKGGRKIKYYSICK